MIYYIKFDGQEVKIEIVTDAEGHSIVKMPDGRELLADLKSADGHKHFSLMVDHKSHEIYFSGRNGDEFNLVLDGKPFQVEVETERQHRFKSLASSSKVDTGEVNIKSPMPGLVTIISVQPGDHVEQGQRLLVLEAMKMENEIRAPRAGIIKDIGVKQGQTVEQNKVLMILE
jgi:biotin carboxyl carrier protein